MNVTSILLRQMQSRPDALAVRYGGADLSYGKFGERVLKTAGGLKDLGVSKGDVVGIEIVDPLSHLLASLALAHLGATGMSVARTMPVPQRDGFFDKTGCVTLLTEDIRSAMPRAQRLRILSWEDVAAYSSMASDAPAEVREDQYWTFVMGSGSTGRPKIMPFTHAQQVGRAELGASWLPYGPDDVLLSLVSMHFYAAKQRALEAMSCGAGLYLDLPGRIDHRDAVACEKVTAIYATVVHLERLLRVLPEQVTPHYKNLRALMVGGSSVSMELRERIKDRLTSNLYVLWGTNESHTATITDRSGVWRLKGTVGRAFHDVEIEVVDDQGSPVAAQHRGLIRVSSPTMINGYLNDPEATNKAFKDGWFYTGDLGYLTEGGELVHLGRADDMMNVGGVNVFPAEIEECLRRQPGVVDVVALPIRHAQTEQDMPVALVEAEPGITLDSKALVKQVHASAGPHALRDLQVVAKIPRNEQGKVQRDQLDQMLRQIWGPQKKKVAVPSIDELASSRFGQAGPTVRFSRPEGAKPLSLTAWLSLLDEGLCNHPMSHFETHRQDEDRGWLEQILTLTRGFLNVLGVPLFDPIRIIECRPCKSSGHRSEANIRLPEASLVSRSLIEGVLKVAFKQASWLVFADVNSFADRERFFNAVSKEILQGFSKFRPYGKSTYEVLRVAHQMGIAYRKLPGGAYQLGWGYHARRIERSTTDRDSALGSSWTRNKLLTAQLLREAGLPAPEHKRASTLTEAQTIASELGFPVVVKPSDRERGEGVEVDVNADRLKTAFDNAKRLSPSKTVLVERQVVGVCHRLFIVADKLLYAVKRLPMGIYADGQASIAKLVEQEVAIQTSLPPWKRSGIRPLDDMAVQMLTRQGWTPESVPPAGGFVALRRIETTAWGGIDEEVTSVVHPDNLKAALAATRLLGLEVAGVDIITEDITQPWYETGAIINEVNYAPLLGGGEISRRYIAQYLDLILEDRGRIPVHVYLGGQQAWAKARSHWNRLCASGVAAYLTIDRETLDASGDPTHIPGGGLRHKLDVLRLRHDVEAVIIVVQSVQCLRDVQVLDHVTSFDVVGSQPAQALRNPQNIPSSAVLTMIQRSKARWSAPTMQNVARAVPLEGRVQ